MLTALALQSDCSRKCHPPTSLILMRLNATLRFIVLNSKCWDGGLHGTADLHVSILIATALLLLSLKGTEVTM